MKSYFFLYFITAIPSGFIKASNNHCRKENFNKTFGITGKPRNETLMESCQPACEDWYYGIKQALFEENLTTVIATAKFQPTSKECWGYELRIIEAEQLNKESNIYFEYNFDGKDFQRKFNVKPGKTYRIRTCVFPQCGRQTIAILETAKNECELKARKYAYNEVKPKRAGCVLEIGSVWKAASDYCRRIHRFNVITFNQTMFVSQSCELFFKDKNVLSTTKALSNTNNTNNDVQILIIVGGCAGVLLLSSFCLYCIAKRWKNKIYGKEIERKEDTKLLGMILHCPGCEVLDEIVKDLVFILKSYNVNVKSPLLEQTMLDAEGGISSFMERNIRQCQFILIVVTQRNKALNSIKHRPYQYALRVLDGLASSGLQKAWYIPIYFTQYKNALNLAPTFLFPSFDYGFWLPYQLKKLITTILNEKTVLSEEDEKLKLFVDQMEIKAKQLQNENHANCQCGTCDNGEIEYPESELNWPAETLSSRSIYLDKVRSGSIKLHLESFNTLSDSIDTKYRR